MSLTIESAKVAGQLAAALEQLNMMIANLHAATDGGASIMQMQCTLVGSGAVLQASLPFSAADSATIFNTLITIAEANAAAINSQLASM